MIQIARRRRGKNGKSIRPCAAWRTHAAAASKRARAEGPAHEIDRSIYRHDDVRAALEELFHGKCAYCEKNLPDTDWDVEHFRPSGRVAGTDHTGYYWLAYTWANLFPSCVACNQRRRDKPTYEERSSRDTRGKADQFPLENETDRARRFDQPIAREQPLLLNPCQDRPELHLTFDPTGEIRNTSARGGTTIRVFHLDRRRANKNRKKIVKRAVEALRIAARSPKATAQLLERYVRQELAADKCEFAAVARVVLKDPERFGL